MYSRRRVTIASMHMSCSYDRNGAACGHLLHLLRFAGLYLVCANTLHARLARSGELYICPVSPCPGDICEAVDGINSIKPERRSPACHSCGRAEGAVVKCAHTHCQVLLHPLCARRRGAYLSARPSVTGQLQYKLYCTAHSDAQRRKDWEAAAQAAAQALGMGVSCFCLRVTV